MRQTEFCKRLGLDTPIIQAPMARSTTPELVAAVSNAGGLGSLGCAALAPDGIRDATAAIRAKTNRGFNLNFFVHTQPRHDAQKAKTMGELLAPYHDELGLGAVPDPFAPVSPFDRDRLDVLLADPPPVVSFHFGRRPSWCARCRKRAR